MNFGGYVLERGRLSNGVVRPLGLSLWREVRGGAGDPGREMPRVTGRLAGLPLLTKRVSLTSSWLCPLTKQGLVCALINETSLMRPGPFGFWGGADAKPERDQRRETEVGAGGAERVEAGPLAQRYDEMGERCQS